MNLVLSVIVVVTVNLWVMVSVSECCHPSRSFRRGGQILRSYVPACIQVLHHYRDQLKKFYPYAFSDFCWTRRQSKPVRKYVDYSTAGSARESTEPFNATIQAQTPKGADLCVLDTDWRFSQLLRDLYRGVKDENPESLQGFTRSVLADLEKTSRMTSSEQLHFLLGKIFEETESEAVQCQILRFMVELRSPNSRLYRNLLMVEPLNYYLNK